MHPKFYSILYQGKWTTVRTCGGPVGAFRGLTGERPREWQEISDRETVVNDCPVIEIDWSYS